MAVKHVELDLSNLELRNLMLWLGTHDFSARDAVIDGVYLAIEARTKVMISEFTLLELEKALNATVLKDLRGIKEKVEIAKRGDRIE
jgi:hypothetical protein